MQRYFVEIKDSEVIFLESDVHHILHVLRMNKGDKIELIYSKKLFLGEIDSINPLHVKVVEQLPSDVELASDVNIIFALSKGDKNDFVIQKATELGANKITFVSTKRCVVKTDEKDFAKRLVRYEKIAKEAAEQCHRLVVPSISYKSSLKDLELADINLVAFEKEAGDTSNSFENIRKNKSINIVIGPEGGFEDSEIDLLKSLGYQVVSLGKRILRCETAATYALSVISYLLEK